MPLRETEKTGPIARLASLDDFHTLLFDTMADGVVLIDLSGRIVECNRTFHARLGYEKHELVGTCITALTPRDPASVADPAPQLLDYVGATFESHYRRKNGSLMPVELSPRLIAIDGASFCFSVVRDLSERQHADRALREQQRIYRAVVETSSAGFWAVDLEGHILEVNEAYARRSGYSRQELLTMSIPDLEASETPEETRAHIEAILRNGSDRFESMHKAKSGEVWPVEVVASFWPVRGGMFVAFLTDQAEKLKTQREIEAHQRELNKLSQAIRQAGEGIVITDTRASIEYVNPAFTEISGHSPEEVLGHSIWNLNGDEASIQKQVRNTLSARKQWHGMLTGRRKDGSLYPVLSSVAPICDEAGRVTHVVSIHKDMTEMKQMELELLQAQKMESMGTLVGGLAHDFNNMLAALLGNVHLAKLSLNEPRALEESLGTIERLAEHGAGVVKQLLTFARKDLVRMEPVLLNDLVSEGFQLAKSVVREDIVHRLDVCEDELVAVADTTQFQQVMLNLANNARDAVRAAEHPKIEWSMSRFEPNEAFVARHPELEGRRLAKISVRDNGRGISAEHLKTIFDPFFTTKAPGEGTGLGLAMAYGAVQRHGGVLEAESEPGRGATFHVYLPLVEADAERKEARAAAAYEGFGTTVLLVDDDENVRRSTAAVLSRMGYNPITAGDGEEALALYMSHRHEIELILTDVIMPGKGGVELANEVRLVDEDLPILLMTGYDWERVASGTCQRSNCRIVSKPVSYDRLGELMRQMLPG